jgi:FtsP/CotA-like multicopper oxidase with cupredoxin domain
MKIQRREFLKGTVALAAASALPENLGAAAANAGACPYLGRTEDCAQFRIIQPGLTISKVESWTQGRYGIEEDANAGEALYNPAWIEKAACLKS